MSSATGATILHVETVNEAAAVSSEAWRYGEKVRLMESPPGHRSSKLARERTNGFWLRSTRPSLVLLPRRQWHADPSASANRNFIHATKLVVLKASRHECCDAEGLEATGLGLAFAPAQLQTVILFPGDQLRSFPPSRSPGPPCFRIYDCRGADLVLRPDESPLCQDWLDNILMTDAA
jgi:hypothetical protein